jgi:hypothetical protein
MRHAPPPVTVARVAAALLAAALAGCQATQAQAPQAQAEKPARMTGTPSSACLTQLTAFASSATKRTVTLTEQAFAQSDQLLLERPLIRGPDGRPLDGRSMERPSSVRLVRAGALCSVIHENSATRTELPDCRCEAL